MTAFGSRAWVWLLCGAWCLAGISPLFAGTGFADPLPLTTLPGDAPSNFTRMYQREADEAFERGDYERAHDLYLNKLARKGDKHAHYMLGHLNEKGLGVPKDPARALAWYALASERGSAGVKAVGTRLSASLSASEHERANAILAELMERFGDSRLLVKAIRRDMRELKRQTGTHLPRGSKVVRSLIITGDGTVNGYDYYQAVRDRIEFRLNLLGGNVTLRDLELIDTPDKEDADREEP